MCFGLVQDQKWSFGNPDWTISTFGNKKQQFSRCKNFYILPEKQGLFIIFNIATAFGINMWFVI